MYLVNVSSKLEAVSRVYEIGEKSHSLLDHPCISATSQPIAIKFYIIEVGEWLH